MRSFRMGDEFGSSLVTSGKEIARSLGGERELEIYDSGGRPLRSRRTVNFPGHLGHPSARGHRSANGPMANTLRSPIPRCLTRSKLGNLQPFRLSPRTVPG